MAARDEGGRGEAISATAIASDAQQRIRPVQRKQPERGAGGQPASQARPSPTRVGGGRCSLVIHLQRKTARRKRSSKQVQAQSGQEGIESRLQDQDLVKRHDAGQRVENPRDEGGAFSEESPRREEDERDRSRSEQDLDDLHGQERAGREHVDRREKVDVKR